MMMDPLIEVKLNSGGSTNGVHKTVHSNYNNGGSCGQMQMGLETPTTIISSDKNSCRTPSKVIGVDEIEIKVDELKDLLEFFSKTTYKAKDTQPKMQIVMQKCLNLFGLDYKYSILPNAFGELSTNYPSSLVILESEKDSSSPGALNKTKNSPLSPHSSSVHENSVEVPKLKELCSKARFARCRARFPIPVILYNQKHICRSATLSGGPEIYGRSSFDYFFSSGLGEVEEGGVGEGEIHLDSPSDWQLFDRVRSQDIRLLKAFQVQTIVDLMVEKKKVKFGVNVTSSEKVDKENRYAEFNIVSLPYPGCEFFKQYRDNGYCAEELVFEWNQGHVDANICVPSDPTAASLRLDWSRYRDWDLVRLSQNYLKLLLGYLRDRDSGLLIHCISGWDRTPLFISLLRLSLWADGLIHKSLNPTQMLYLTLAYDWLLFGHDLEDRLSKGEEILFFCFNFLNYISAPEFSMSSSCSSASRTEKEETKLGFLRTRNDSDLQLDGVLLDEVGENLQGSNWSLNSTSSSLSSSKSIESSPLPPSYFLLHSPNDSSSWEDCKLMTNGTRQATTTSNTPSTFSTSNISSSNIPNTPTTISTSSRHRRDLYSPSAFSKSHSPNSLSSHLLTPSPTSSSSNSSYATNSNYYSTNSTTSRSNCNNSSVPASIPPTTSSTNGRSSNGRTSPVAVPLPLTPTNYSPGSFHRHDSHSSASIGSWQLITGVGSLREVSSSSAPGPNISHHHHPMRLLPSESSESKDGSVSSCTLVQQLTPSPPFPQVGRGGVGGESGFETELSLALLEDQFPALTPSSSSLSPENGGFYEEENQTSNTIRTITSPLHSTAHHINSESTFTTTTNESNSTSSHTYNTDNGTKSSSSTNDGTISHNSTNGNNIENSTTSSSCTNDCTISHSCTNGNSTDNGSSSTISTNGNNTTSDDTSSHNCTNGNSAGNGSNGTTSCTNGNNTNDGTNSPKCTNEYTTDSISCAKSPRCTNKNFPISHNIENVTSSRSFCTNRMIPDDSTSSINCTNGNNTNSKGCNSSNSSNNTSNTSCTDGNNTHSTKGTRCTTNNCTNGCRCSSSSNSSANSESMRKERLEAVRLGFSRLYETSVRVPIKVGGESGTSSALGFLIGNIATKVGIRSAVQRTTHV